MLTKQLIKAFTSETMNKAEKGVMRQYYRSLPINSFQCLLGPTCVCTLAFGVECFIPFAVLHLTRLLQLAFYHLLTCCLLLLGEFEFLMVDILAKELYCYLYKPRRRILYIISSTDCIQKEHWVSVRLMTADSL